MFSLYRNGTGLILLVDFVVDSHAFLAGSSLILMHSWLVRRLTVGKCCSLTSHCGTKQGSTVGDCLVIPG